MAVWRASTDTNVCFAEYSYLKDNEDNLDSLKETIETRFDIVANQASDFIIKLMDEKVFKSLDNIIMSGFCFGAYIAAYTCRELEKRKKHKVKALFGEFYSRLYFVNLYD